MDFWLSVVIPVYNAEQYLKKCIDSLHPELHDDIQIILINDGSSDHSGEICLAYKARFPESVVFIDKKNAGVSAARNDGLERANGKYVFFLDSDDYVSKDYYKKIKTFTEKQKADLYVYGYRKVSGDGKVLCTNDPYDEGVFKVTPEFCTDIFEKLEYQAWNKLFMNSIIQEKGLRFDTSMKWSEDLDFWVRYMSEVHEVGCMNAYLYNYLDNGAGAVANVKIEAFENYKRAFQHQRDLLRYNKAEPEAFRNLMKQYIEHVSLTVYACHMKKIKISDLKRVLRKTYIKNDLRYGVNSVSAKIKKVLLKHNMLRLLCMYFKIVAVIK